jgi:protein arginine kinase
MGVSPLRYAEIGTGWFSAAGPEQDVAVSTRLRLVRNVSAYPFPDFMSEEQADELSSLVRYHMEDLWPGSTRLVLGELTSLERMILVERNLVSREVAEAPRAELYIHQSEQYQLVVNGREHLHLQAISPGFAFEECVKRVFDLEQELDQRLRFAATLQFGYLSSRTADLGTGMRASVMLHLPALMEREWLMPALKTIVDEEIGLKAFGGAPDDSTAAMYQLFTKLSIGCAENEMLEKLEDAVTQLIHYERNAREATGVTRGDELRKRVAGAAASLRNTRTMSDAEAYRALSWLRLGIALGTIEKMLFEEVTSLFFRCQASHMAAAGGNGDDGEQRAKLLRNALRNRR